MRLFDDQLLFEILCSNTETLKIKLKNYLRDIFMFPEVEDGFIYAEGEIPILLVAHMDTVFSFPPGVLYYDDEKDILFNKKSGIGADDRSGIYAILEILKKYRPHVLFTDEEEIGGIGAEKAVFSIKRPNVKYIIEFDRKGSNDCVFYNCANQKFQDYVESFGFVTNTGSFSDISILAPEWDIAAVNLSCGYYFPHSKNEYMVPSELRYNIERVETMIEDYDKVEYFNYQSRFLNTFPYLDGDVEEHFTRFLDIYFSNSVHQEKIKIIGQNKN